MKLSKCNFFSKEIQYLGHILSTKGIQPLPLEMQAIKNIHPPITLKQVHAFLSLVGYCRKFIKTFAKIAKPLILLTCQQVKFDWTPTHHEAFLHLKESIKHLYCVTLTLTRGILSIQMHQMTPAECSYPRNTMVQNFQLPFSHTLFWKHKENGAQLNKKLMEFIMPLQNGINISKEWTS